MNNTTPEGRPPKGIPQPLGGEQHNPPRRGNVRFGYATDPPKKEKTAMMIEPALKTFGKTRNQNATGFLGTELNLGVTTTAVEAVGGGGTLGVPVWETWLSDGSCRRSIPRVRVGGGAVVPGRLSRVSPPIGYIPMLSLSCFLGELGTRRDGGVSGGLGIDLKKRAHEVRKLFYAGGFTRTLLREGIDPEDFLQEVYRGLLTRNNGTCPWDHSLSSFGHYVHIVIRCLLSNYLRKERRHTSMEEVSTDGELVAGVVGPSPGGEDFNRRDLLRDVFGGGGELEVALSVVGGLEGGKSRKEVADALGLPLLVVDGILRRVRISLTT